MTTNLLAPFPDKTLPERECAAVLKSDHARRSSRPNQVRERVAAVRPFRDPAGQLVMDKRQDPASVRFFDEIEFSREQPGDPRAHYIEVEMLESHLLRHRFSH